MAGLRLCRQPRTTGARFEVTTGIPVTPKGKREMARTEIGELEAMLAQPHHEVQPALDPAPEGMAETVAI